MFTTLYQEKNSFILHHNKKYDLNKIFKIVHKKQIKKIKLDKLKWILNYSKLDPKRVENANLVYPIIIVKEKGKYFILDGIHRFKKWFEKFDELNLPILAKEISQKELKTTEI